MNQKDEKDEKDYKQLKSDSALYQITHISVWIKLLHTSVILLPKT